MCSAWINLKSCHRWKGLTLSKTTNFDFSILKEFSVDNLKFGEYCGDLDFSKRIENTMGKGEIACLMVFLKNMYWRHVKGFILKGLFIKALKMA